MSSTRDRLRSERGFTLVEVTVAATLLIVGVLGTLTLLDGANRATARTKAREGAVNLAREAIEAARAVPYPDLTVSGTVGELQAQPGLADASTQTGWNVVRRGITYTIVPTVCSVDDATDGLGTHTGLDMCADSTGTGTADINPDDYKRVALDVTWRDGATTWSARQQAVINNPGSAFAPAVKTLVPTPAGPTITSQAVTNIAFAATTSSRAEDFKWNIDGVVQGSATPVGASRTSWTFNWPVPLSVVDGSYQLGAEAFDQFGQSGTSRTVTLQLNRFAPATPTSFAGGRNPLWNSVTSNFAEFEWSPSPERDIVGYRVKRMAGLTTSGGDPVVCETSVEDAEPTICRASVPSSLLSALIPPTYYVVAVAPARGTSGLEESPPATKTVGAPTPPGPPQGLTGVRTADGIVLSWSAPADNDIRYYRVYRDDRSSPDARVDRTGSGSENVITDPNAEASGHTYWITAVDQDLAESDFAEVVVP
jgi:Tfp pilus assembly protein PilV